MDNIIKQLHEIKNDLDKPFPYRDTDQIQIDFQTEFLTLSDEEDFLIGDFNTYCMNIAGTLSYVLTNAIDEIPHFQIQSLNHSFFESFKQYSFFQDKIENYKDFYQEYKKFEEARKLLLYLLSK